MSVLRSVWHRVNPYWLSARRRTERVSHRLRALPTKWLRENWPRQRATEAERRTVGIVIVNFNTRVHVARLLYSIFRTFDRDRVVRVVVVDNASTDGSVEFLTAARDAGLIDLILNRTQRYHGPGVNQGIKHLCRLTRNAGPDGVIDYVWVLDSDTVVIRPDVLDHAIRAVQAGRAGLAGEFSSTVPSLPTGYAHICCLLIDPTLVWKRGFEPMWESGLPAEALQLDCVRRGVPRIDYPFMRDGAVIHLGSATLKAILDHGIADNRYAGWAASDKCLMYSFHGNPDAPVWYEEFLREYTASVPGHLIKTLADLYGSGGSRESEIPGRTTSVSGLH